ncbi:MAG: hypothetical protein ACRCU6_02165 [Fusobacteriaceae bacterium]
MSDFINRILPQTPESELLEESLITIPEKIRKDFNPENRIKLILETEKRVIQDLKDEEEFLTNRLLEIRSALDIYRENKNGKI